MTYTHVAVFIHWVTALAIIGLLAVGNFMTGLDPTDSLRFSLTQTHKTIGILVLLLSVLRLAWRLTHRAPPHPAHAPAWEKFAASLSHLAFYILILLLPLSGWAMVSVSTLNIDTLLFNKIPWPHLPLIEWFNLGEVSAREQWESFFHHAHYYAGNVLVILLVVHVAAALKHHYVDKDDVLRRMKPRWREPGFLALLAVVAVAVGSATYALIQSGQTASASLVATGSSVTLVADVTSEETVFEFSDTVVSANIDRDNLAASTLEVIVPTGTVTSRNTQAESSLPAADWFDVENYPQASFQSTLFEPGPDPDTLLVTGDLSIKDTTRTVDFLLSLDTDGASGETTAAVDLTINRFDYLIGVNSQPDDEYVGSTVTVQVRFQLGTEH